MTPPDAEAAPLRKPKPIDDMGRPSIVEDFNAYSQGAPSAVGDSGNDIPDALVARGITGHPHYYAWLRDEFVWPEAARVTFLDAMRGFEAAGERFALTYRNLDATPRAVDVRVRQADLAEARPLPTIVMVGPGPG